MKKIYYNRLNFYGFYVLQKLFLLPFQLKKPRFKFYIYELAYSVLKIFKRSFMLTYPFNDELIITRYEKFFIRPKTTDAVVVSPAYEYFDKKELLKIINTAINNGKKVLFVDIGSNIGCYSIYLGKRFSKDKINIISVEASPSNYKILLKNILGNNLKDSVELFNIALWDKDNLQLNLFYNKKMPGGSNVKEDGYSQDTIESKTLDSLLKKHLNSAEVLVIKIDVEGAEKKVLMGGKEVLNSFKEIYLLIESSHDNETISFLKEFGFDNFSRLTPYNLWAYKKNFNK